MIALYEANSNIVAAKRALHAGDVNEAVEFLCIAMKELSKVLDDVNRKAEGNSK